MSAVSLRLDWCSYEAAKYAVQHWHYSQSLPTSPLVKVGVWEEGQFIGCVLFSRGSNNNMLLPYGLTMIQGCELTRVALTTHQAPTSQIVSIALRLLRYQAPGLRLIISYADPNHGHHGGIYQAMGWLYAGQTAADVQYVDQKGRIWHRRQVSRTGVSRQYGILRRVPSFAECHAVPLQGKHRYLYPLDAAMRAQLLPFAQPYPHRATSIQDAPDVQSGEGGAAPTVALQE